MLNFAHVAAVLNLLKIRYEIQPVGTTGRTAYIPNFTDVRLSIYVGEDGCTVQEHPRHLHEDARSLDSRHELRTWLDERQRRWNPWPSPTESLLCRGISVDTFDTFDRPGEKGRLLQGFAPNGDYLHLFVNDITWKGTLSWTDAGTPTQNVFEDEWALRDFLRLNWPISRVNAHVYDSPYDVFSYKYSETGEQWNSPWMYSRPVYVRQRLIGDKFTNLGLGQIHASCPAHAFRAWWWLRKLMIADMERGAAQATVQHAVKLHTNSTYDQATETFSPALTPLREHILEHLRELRLSANNILRPYEQAEEKREADWRVEMTADLKERLNWANLKSMLADGQPSDEDNVVRVYVTSVMNLTPSGKFYTAWARSNVTDFEARKDAVFWEVFEQVIHEQLGEHAWSEQGEDDPTDLFICTMRESAEAQA